MNLSFYARIYCRLAVQFIFLAGLMMNISPNSFSQDVTNSDVIKQWNFIPPTPEVASLFKFSEVPVDLASGTPNISIDLYTIKSGSLQHNINLAYHASAIRVNEIASTSGLGWNLNVGGAIMHQVRGMTSGIADYNDEDVHFLHESEITQSNISSNFSYFKNMFRGYRVDIMPDEYSLNIEGFSGKFFQDTNHVFVTNPISNVKITRHGKGFSVINGLGVQYIFDLPQYTEDLGTALSKNTSGLNLTKIISADRKDTIYFEYSAFNLYEYQYNFAYTRISQLPENRNSLCPEPTETTNWHPSPNKLYLLFYNNIIQKIRFKGGYIQFNYANREDRRVSGEFLPRISEMQIFTSENILLKAYRFSCNIFQTGGVADIENYISPDFPTIDLSKRLRLDQIDEVDASNHSQTLYKFEYNTSPQLPGRYSFSQDYWGFYNGKPNTDAIRKRSVVKLTLPLGSVYEDIGGANKDPDPYYAKACILTKMTYPTGGYSLFEYEGNTVTGGGLSGGIRIKSIKYYSGTSQLEKTESYTYENGNQLTAPSILENDLFTYKLVQNCPPPPPPAPQYYCVVLENPLETIRDQPLNEIGFLSGNPVAYKKVTKSIVNIVSGERLSTEYNYEISHLDFEWPAAFVAGVRRNMPVNNSWKGARLIRRIDYKDMGGGVFVPVKTLKNAYKLLSIVFHTFVVVPVFEPMLDNYPCANVNFGGVGNISYPLQSERVELDSTVEVQYSLTGTDSVSAVTKFRYDAYNGNYYLRNVAKYNSHGSVDSTNYKYPFDYLPNAVMGKMIGRNMLNAVIEEKQHFGSQHSAVKKTIKDWFNDSLVLEPQYVEHYFNGNKTKDIYQVNAMNDNSKILEFITEAGIAKSLIWDRFKQNLIAEATNAPQSDVAYSSFEDDSKGNWVFSGIPYTDPTSPTGKKAYMLGSSITRSGLSASKTYIVSYWKKSGSVSVNSTTAVPGRIVNGWTYYQHKVVNPSGGLITVSGSSGVIDELRLYPANAQMTTYTYAPLVGMTSQCDVNNRILYYEYDELQRLLLIRDQDRNIVKKFAYNYSGQAENINIYYNTAKSGTFYRTGCTSCQVGGPTVYTVPANTYLSTFSQTDADNKAAADVSNNGQAYAQLMGTCVAPSAVPVTGTNTSSYDVDVVLQNVCTSAAYSFTLTHNTSGPLSGIPQGVYNVSMSYPGSTPLRYKVNDFTIIQAQSANFYNVYFNPSSNLVRVTP